MDKTQDRTAAAGDSVDPGRWQQELDMLFATKVAPLFARREPRAAARAMLAGLLSPLERKNGWWLAEHAGHAAPDAMQRLLRTARWDETQLIAGLRGYVVEQLGHAQAVLVADETGFAKKGTCSAGVARQYSGTLGRVDNCQVGVFVGYATDNGHALIDRRLYLPKAWTSDPGRCRKAGVPASVRFATKPQLAADMIEQAVDAGVPAGWVAADEVYGTNACFRARIRARGLGYVLAVACHTRVPTAWGPQRIDELADRLSRRAWQRASCGTGSKGERFYDWAWIDINQPGDGHHSALVRRGRDGTRAYYLCWSPQPAPLATLVRVAGRRWSVETAFQQAKTHTGLDHYQVRTWAAWQRFTALAILALAFLAAQAATARPTTTAHPPVTPDTTALTVGEIHRLLANLTITSQPAPHVISWSTWRRRHQGHARWHHHRRHERIEQYR